MLTKRYSPGVDYLTATQVITWDTDSLYLAAKSVKDREQFFSLMQYHFRFFGYEGWRLDQKGHFCYGENEHQTRALVQMSGQFARDYWDKFVRVCDHVSRLDLRVDCELREPEEQIAKICFDEIQELGVGKLAKKYALIEGLKGCGQTLYVGARSSAQFGRLYDKGAQQGQKAGSVWRYEVEYKKPLAQAIAMELLELRDNEAKGQSYLEAIGQLVYHWFDDRLVPPLFDRQAKYTKEIGVSISAKMSKLEWLRTQVSPTVAKLIDQGNSLEVFRALGILEYIRNPIE
jgi:hypothetical protein